MYIDALVTNMVMRHEYVHLKYVNVIAANKNECIHLPKPGKLKNKFHVPIRDETEEPVHRQRNPFTLRNKSSSRRTDRSSECSHSRMAKSVGTSACGNCIAAFVP